MDNYFKKGYNTKSIIAFVLGVLSLIIPILGLILGMAAVLVANSLLRGSHPYNGTDKGLAVAGKVCGFIVTLFYALLILYYVLYF